MLNRRSFLGRMAAAVAAAVVGDKIAVEEAPKSIGTVADVPVISGQGLMYWPGEIESVTWDAEVTAEFQAGKWQHLQACSFCGRAYPADETACKRCGGPRDRG